MTNGIVIGYLNTRKAEPSLEAEVFSFLSSGDEVSIVEVVSGEEYKGIKSWYQLEGDLYIPTNEVSLNLNEPLFLKKLKMDKGIENESSALDSFALEDYWWIKDYGIDTLWAEGLTGKGVKIAVLDSGLCLPHESLTQEITLYDASDSASITDYNDHGSHVLGIIAANKEEPTITGISFESDFYFAKVESDDFGYDPKYLIKAIDWAVEMEVDIISISIGQKEDHNGFELSLKSAIEKGILVVCAEGKKIEGDEMTALFYPASYSSSLNMMAIGGVTQEKKPIASTINVNNTTLFAPGDKILSLGSSNNYVEKTGSSQATPFVSGVASLLLQKSRKNDPNYKAIDIKDILLSTSEIVDFGKVINPIN